MNKLLVVVAMALVSTCAVAEVVRVSECVRDPNVDYWAASDVHFAMRIMREVFANAGVQPRMMAYDENHLFNPDKAEVLCSAFKTPELQKRYRFPLQPMGSMHFALYALPERAEKMLKTKITDWGMLRVAYSPVSQGMDTDRQRYFEHAKLEPVYVEYETSIGAVEALKAGEVDALFLYTPSGKRPEGLTEIVPIGDRNVYFAVRKDRPSLMHRLVSSYREWYIDNIGKYDAWREELLGIAPPEHRVRMAAYCRGDLFEIKGDGHRVGIIEDWMKALAAHTKWNIDFVYGEYDESIAAVKAGRLDLVGGVGFAPIHRGKLLYPHTPIGMLRVYLWAKQGSRFQPGNPRSWEGMNVGLLSGTQSAARVKQQLETDDFDITCHEYLSDKELTEAFLAGDIDACVDVEKSELANAVALHVYASHPMYICTALDRTALFEELETALDEICDDLPRYMRMISERHYGIRSGKAAFTMKEADWLNSRVASGEPVVIDISPWPFPVVNRDGTFTGFSGMFFDEISKRTGLKFVATPQTGIQTAEAKFLRGETQFWIPYPETPEFLAHGATPVFSLAVPQLFSEHIGEADAAHREYTLYAGSDAPEELIGILRKTVSSMDEDEIQELFLMTISDRTVVHRVFGHTAAELKHIFFTVGGICLLVIMIYGGTLLILWRREAARATAAAAKAEEHAQSKSRFLAMMSHELRTPLNAVIGFAEFLSRPDITLDQRHEYIEGILLSSNALLSLINDVLDLSKLEAGAMEMRKGTCDVKALLTELPAIFGYRVRKHGVALTIRKIGVEEIPLIKFSQQGMRQILINIVGNSAKFTEHGEIKVLYGWVSWSNTLHIEIHDTGCGMSKEKMDKLFDPFVQDFEMRMKGALGENKGTGLGLPIVKRMVDSARGTIHARSEIGKGTAFIIDIPDLEVVIPSELYQTPDEQEAKKEKREIHDVLVVDDMAMNRKILGIHLHNLGFGNIHFAENGAEALKVMHDWTPEVVLTDMWMPVMDGAQLASAMLADPRLAHIPIVAITADVDVDASYDMSLFAKVLPKPVTGEKLKALFDEI